MIYISLGLIHNKSGNGNRRQIEDLLAVGITRHHADANRIEFNPSTQAGDIVYDWYTFDGLAVEHEVSFFQVIPFGVNEPNNLYTLNSRKVFYGNGDNDKVGTHPRFHNWGLKRAFDHGANVAGIITDVGQFTIAGLQFQLNRLVDRRILVFPLWGMLASSRLFEIVTTRQPGQLIGETFLREDLPLSSAVDDLRARIIARGFEYE
jgi:hypothetical protein